jgi:hypothetical protein
VLFDVKYQLLRMEDFILKDYSTKEMNIVRGCIQKFPDWPPGARTANGTALCH